MEAHLYDPQLIDPALWDRAGWYGLGYLFDRMDQEPPRVGPIFRNPAAGRRIFEAWHRRLGTTDQHEVLRLVLVSGLRDGRYSVLLSTDPEGVASWAEAEEDAAVEFVVTHTRVCHLPGPPSPFLNTLRAYAEARRPYLLTPFSEDAQHHLDPMPDLGILKRHLEVRRADEISPDEPDGIVLQ